MSHCRYHGIISIRTSFSALFGLELHQSDYCIVNNKTSIVEKLEEELVSEKDLLIRQMSDMKQKKKRQIV